MRIVLIGVSHWHTPFYSDPVRGMKDASTRRPTPCSRPRGRAAPEGTHRGTLHGVPATGKRVVFGGTDIFRVADGRIAEGWSNYDRLSILQQIGAVPGSGPGQGQR